MYNNMAVLIISEEARNNLYQLIDIACNIISVELFQ